MAHVLDKELDKYWELLDTGQKKSIISMIKSFLHPSENNERISIEQYNKEINEAMARIDEGKFTTQKELEKESKKW
jgi:hypothetical protein